MDLYFGTIATTRHPYFAGKFFAPDPTKPGGIHKEIASPFATGLARNRVVSGVSEFIQFLDTTGPDLVTTIGCVDDVDAVPMGSNNRWPCTDFGLWCVCG